MRFATARRKPGVLLIAALVVAATLASGKASHAAGSTQAEIQIALCADPDQVISALALHPRAKAYATWLFDDPALTLFERGLRFRLRATDRGGELTLKAAIADCAAVPPTLMPADAGKCEHDVHGEQVTAAVSLTTRLDVSAMKRLLAGSESLADALSPAQVRYLRDATRSWPLPSGLRALGPIEVSTYRGREKPYDVDISRLPAGERYIEASRKVALAQAAAAHRSFADDLARSGITMCADQSAQAVNKLRALLRAP